jgi:hypothetical protein
MQLELSSSFSSPPARKNVSGVEAGINLKDDGGTYGPELPEVPVSVEMSDGTGGVELRVEVEVTVNWVNRASEANGLTLGGFRVFFGGAGFAEARMSAALLGVGCIRAMSTIR